MVKRKDDVVLQEEVLATQIPEFVEPQPEPEVVHVPEKISTNILNRNRIDEDGMADFEARTGGTASSILQKAATMWATSGTKSRWRSSPKASSTNTAGWMCW